jgi:outer membrane protein assembly factor BamB
VQSFFGRLLIACVLSGAAVAGPSETGGQNDWPQWRGPLGTGVAPAARPPLKWSENKNIRWKTELPGKGHSTPIVWGERIFP